MSALVRPHGVPAAVAAALVAIAALPTARGQSYTVVEIGTFGGPDSWTHALNDLGQVVGAAELSGGIQHAYLWDNGVLTDLGTLGGLQSTAFDINNSGQVVGWSEINMAHDTHAYLWQAGIMTDLGTLSGNPADLSEAMGVNEAGQVVGIAVTGYQGYNRAFLWDSASGMIDLGTLGGGNSTAYAINESGQVVGWANVVGGSIHGFLWQSGAMTDLGTLGGNYSRAADINQVGQIVGRSKTSAGPRHAFLWESGTMSDLGGSDTDAVAINSAGVAVGWMQVGGIYYAALFRNGTITDLNTLIPPGSGWFLEEATDINDLGWIAGNGYHNGQYRGFLLIPFCEGDLDGDSDVDLGDLTILLNNYAGPGVPSAGGDVDGDGDTDLDDLTILLSAYGTSCT